MNKNLIIGALAIAAIWYFMKSKDQSNVVNQISTGPDDIVKPDREKQLAGINLNNVHKAI